MESNYYNREFEHMVRQNADQYRMYPSEKVWKGIHNTIHTRRRWYGIGLAFLLLTTGAVTWVMLTGTSGNKQLLSNAPLTSITKNITAHANAQPVLILPAKKQDKEVTLATTSVDIRTNPFISQVNTIPPVELNDEVEYIVEERRVQPQPQALSAVSTSITQPPASIRKNVSPAGNREIARNKKESSATAMLASKNSNHLPVSIIDNTEAAEVKKPDQETAAPVKELLNLPPFTIESVINSYSIRISRSKKISWQLYFTPTVSYRKLEENKKLLLRSQLASPILNTAVNDDINNVVMHKPDLGLELGIGAGYPIAKNVKLTAGVQLNVSKYDIKAYPYQMEEARIVLNNANGSRSVSTIETNYRATESYTRPYWLSNYYISVSVPIGMELKIAGKKSLFMGVGGTIQPTYILADRAYLISTDFKNYAKDPSLTRKTNVNSSFELFAGYNTGKLKWRVGPQVRYQLLSSFKGKYPVKEHLLNYGLKVGLMLR